MRCRANEAWKPKRTSSDDENGKAEKGGFGVITFVFKFEARRQGHHGQSRWRTFSCLRPYQFFVFVLFCFVVGSVYFILLTNDLFTTSKWFSSLFFPFVINTMWLILYNLYPIELEKCTWSWSCAVEWNCTIPSSWIVKMPLSFELESREAMSERLIDHVLAAVARLILSHNHIYRVFPIKCNILERHISAFSNARKFRKKVFER